MFVNRLRDKLPGHEIFNLAHRGYGTDQELLTVRRWRPNPAIELVVLMMSENDVGDNNSTFRYHKPKPKFEVVKDPLVLTGVPVPKLEAWTGSLERERVVETWWEKLKNLLLRSYFLHDVALRLYRMFQRWRRQKPLPKIDLRLEDLSLTARILQALKDEVEQSGAKLIVFFIPSKREIEKLGNDPPYQIKLAALCQKLGIEHVDLAPSFKKTWYRTYFRRGKHWNASGHQVAAESSLDYLRKALKP